MSYDTIIATAAGSTAPAPVFVEGRATDLVGKQRTGRFLRAAHKAPALSATEAELASVS